MASSDQDTPSIGAWRLPDGARLVHIGPPKTGTTALQAALFEARESLLDQGVRYIGRQRHSADAIRAVMNRPSFRQRGRVPSGREWSELVGEVRNARESLAVLSSEFLAGADPAVVRRIAADLEPRRTFVVAALRPLASLLSSQWQQDVRRGTREAFEPWLRSVLGVDERPNAMFWRTHRNDRILADWAAVVGADHVIAIVIDDGDRDGLFRSFERLLGLRAGTLQPQEDVSNRSLTLSEAEAVRALNVAFSKTGLDWSAQARMIHMGAAKQLWRRPADPRDPRIEPPQWALDRAAALDREMLGAIAASGVRLQGDPETLLRRRESRLEGDRQPDVSLSPDAAATLAIGLLYGTGLARDPDAAPSSNGIFGSRALAPFTARELALGLAGRGARLVTAPGRRLVRRIRPVQIRA